MRNVPPPLSRDVVLIGGGHTHALVLRRWGMNPVLGARLTVINPAPTAPYTGMLPGFVAGHYRREALDIDLVRLARFAGAQLIFGRATAIDREAKRICIDGRPDVHYDIASVDIGITSDIPDLEGFAENGVAAKPLGPFATAWDKFVTRNEPGPIVIIGAGIGGVELALAMQHRLGGTAEITLVDGSEALTGVKPQTRSALLAEIRRAGIKLLEHTRPTRLAPKVVALNDGREIPSDFTVSTAGARPFRWLAGTGLALTDGFIDVDATLRSTTDSSIYAVGDCAQLTHAPRPKAGVFAVRAAPVLANNLVAELTGGARRRFHPQANYLKLISLGRKAAIADKYAIAPKAPWVWTWKDKIDQAFMSRLSEWPKKSMRVGKPLVAKESQGSNSLCGGCGAKVGGDLLSEALQKLEGHKRTDVLTGPGDDAAVLEATQRNQVITTDHLRAFWDDPYVMTRIAAVHAMSDVLAMGAEPQAMLAHITLPRMADELQPSTLEACLCAASEIAREAGAALVGGHTSMGAEMSLGFTVTGLLSQPALTLDGATPGQLLVLSRPIGSGTIMAAEMQGKARGEDVQECLEAMSSLHLETAEALASSASAMTDVTGFGLAGHAERLANASGVTLEIDVNAVPLYNGAEALADAGIRSTIYAANRRATPVSTPDSGRSALLFDPQTSGGLLATVAADAADRLPGVSIIGKCVPREITGLKFV